MSEAYVERYRALREQQRQLIETIRRLQRAIIFEKSRIDIKESTLRKISSMELRASPSERQALMARRLQLMSDIAMEKQRVNSLQAELSMAQRRLDAVAVELDQIIRLAGREILFTW